MLQLDPISWHLGYKCTPPACMSVIVASHQQMRLKQLQLTWMHICSLWGWTSRYICYTYLPQTNSYGRYALTQRAGKHSCSIPSGMYVTDASGQQLCLYKLHTIHMHVCYSLILSVSMYITFVHDHQLCPLGLHPTIRHFSQQSCLLNLHIQACMSDAIVPGQHLYSL